MIPISAALLVFVFSWTFMIVVLHIGIYRFWFKQNPPKSPQAFLIKFILGMNVFLYLGIAVIAYQQKRMEALFWMFLFGFIFSNGISYGYFHFFNMSETARRVRILLQIYSQKRLNVAELKDIYSPGDMVSFRIQRLLASGQIVHGADNRYRISSRFLLRVAFVIEWVRKLLGFADREKQ